MGEIEQPASLASNISVRDETSTYQTQRKMEVLKDKKVINNHRIYKREGPINEEEKPCEDMLKRYLPQFLANFAINIIMADMGLAFSYPSLVIGYVLKQNSTMTEVDHFLNLDIFKDITVDRLQSSVYSCLQFLFILPGSLTGGILVDMIGRKKVIFAANVPLLLSWLIYFFSQDVAMLYIASIISGIGIGVGESAIATYQGEVTEPRIRGIVINFAILWLSVFLLGPYVLHLAVPSWRWIALLNSVVPICGGIIGLLVPESPTWLLSRGQVTLAEKALFRLRGGATKEEIRDEMQAIASYHYTSAYINNQHPAQYTHSDRLISKESLKERWEYFKSDCIRKPFLLSCTMFCLVYTTGVSTIRPFINPTLNMMHYIGDWTVIGLTMTLAGVMGNIFAVIVVGYTGKRPLVLSALLLNGLSSLVIGIALSKKLSVVISLVMLHIMVFVSGYGIIPIPWILQSEIYPFRGRGFSAGLAAGCSYLMGFIASLIYLPLADSLSLDAMFYIFFVFSAFGFIYIYIRLPETEGRMLEQIETFFRSDKPAQNHK